MAAPGVEPFAAADCDVLVVDANAAWRTMAFGLARAADAFSQRRERSLRIVVPAIVHAEHWYQERRRWGLGFRLDPVRKAMRQLEDLGVEFCAYSPEDAEAHGNVLHFWFPTHREWDAARGGAGSTTVDWFIVSFAAARGAWVVTDDGGREFGWYPRRVGYRAVLTALAGE